MSFREIINLNNTLCITEIVFLNSRLSVHDQFPGDATYTTTPPPQPYPQLLVQEDTPATSCPKCLLSKITEQYILTYRASACYSSNRSGLLSCPVPWPFPNPHGFGPRPGPVPRPQFSPPQVGSSSPVPSAWPSYQPSQVRGVGRIFFQEGLQTDL